MSVPHRMTHSSSREKKTYGPPSLPHTPSRAINTMLETHCGSPVDNVAKAAVVYYICGIFQLILKVYELISNSNMSAKLSSQGTWIISCGVISAGVVLKSFLIFHLIMSCSVIFYNALYYGTITLGLFGVGLGVSGMVFFDKQDAVPVRAGKELFDDTSEKPNKSD